MKRFSRRRNGDGTESVSSFVLEKKRISKESKKRASSPASITTATSSSLTESLEDPSVSSASGGGGSVPPVANKKGFVNMCVSKVKNILNTKNGS